MTSLVLQDSVIRQFLRRELPENSSGEASESTGR